MPNDHESTNVEAAAYLARESDAGPGDDRPTRAEADREAALDRELDRERRSKWTGAWEPIGEVG